MKNQDTYQEVQVIKFPNMTARIYRPILTAEEKEKRMKAIHKAAAELLKK